MLIYCVGLKAIRQPFSLLDNLIDSSVKFYYHSSYFFHTYCLPAIAYLIILTITVLPNKRLFLSRFYRCVGYWATETSLYLSLLEFQ